jgi:hypothetical protein
MSEETIEKQPLTIRESLMVKARALANQKADQFDLVTQFGFSEHNIFRIDIKGRKVPFSTTGTVRTDLDALTENIRDFLREHLPTMIFNELLDEYLSREQS